VGLTEQDALLALGVVPVATSDWIGLPGGIGPWAEDELGDEPRPVLLDTSDGIQFERVAAQRPDLIIALYAGLTKQEYEKLSRIAPTVAQPAEHNEWGIPWQEATVTIGRILSREADAQAVVAEVDERFAAERAAHPEFAGQTAAMATPYEGYYVYGPDDPRTRVLADLGFTIPDGLDEIAGNSFGGNISRERLDLLDVGAMVWLANPADAAKIRADPLYRNLTVGREGRDVFIGEESPINDPASFVTALSLPYLLDSIVPMLAAAADGDPATRVE
jgi:iron complex transport system substrate-binding protein